MSPLSTLLKSLLITSVFSFLTPVLLFVGVLGTLALLAYVPLLNGLSQFSLSQLMRFLSVFGSGSAIAGVMVIAIVCCLVGVLFDTYTFYRYDKLQ